MPCTSHLRQARNCRKVHTRNVGYLWAPDLLRCPWSQITPDVAVILQQWQDWRTFRAVPPWGSDPCAWPALVWEGIALCEQEQTQAESERAKAEVEQWQRKKR